MIYEKYYRVIRFLLSGGCAAATEYTVFVLLHFLDIGLVAANVFSFICGLAVSFALNKFWVFSHKGRNVKQPVLYLMLACANLFISSSAIALLVDGIHIPALLAKLIMMAMIASWNFIIFKRVIFKKS